MKVEPAFIISIILLMQIANTFAAVCPVCHQEIIIQQDDLEPASPVFINVMCTHFLHSQCLKKYIQDNSPQIQINEFGQETARIWKCPAECDSVLSSGILVSPPFSAESQQVLGRLVTPETMCLRERLPHLNALIKCSASGNKAPPVFEYKHYQKTGVPERNNVSTFLIKSIRIIKLNETVPMEIAYPVFSPPASTKVFPFRLTTNPCRLLAGIIVIPFALQTTVVYLMLPELVQKIRRMHTNSWEETPNFATFLNLTAINSVFVFFAILPFILLLEFDHTPQQG